MAFALLAIALVLIGFAFARLLGAFADVLRPAVAPLAAHTPSPEGPTMKIDVHHYHHFPDEGATAFALLARLLKQMEARLMSRITDEVNSVLDAVKAAVARTNQLVAALQTQIADLDAKVADGTATDGDVATLEQAKTMLDQLNPATPTVVPPADVPPADAPPADA